MKLLFVLLCLGFALCVDIVPTYDADEAFTFDPAEEFSSPLSAAFQSINNPIRYRGRAKRGLGPGLFGGGGTAIGGQIGGQFTNAFFGFGYGPHLNFQLGVPYYALGYPSSRFGRKIRWTWY